VATEMVDASRSRSRWLVEELTWDGLPDEVTALLAPPVAVRTESLSQNPMGPVEPASRASALLAPAASRAARRRASRVS